VIMNKTIEDALKGFVCELAHATSTFKDLKALYGHCHNDFISCLTSNIEHACKNNKLGFTGLHLQHEKDGRILIRVSSPGKSASKAFSLNKYSFKEAYIKSVTLRAQYCGFIGTIPLDKVKIPCAEDLLKISHRIKGEKWCDQYNIVKYYING
jgi:hypothetical protein